MTTFQPSPCSARNNCGEPDYGDYYGLTAAAAALIGAGVSVAGGVTTTAIGTSSSKKAQARQLAHEEKMAAKQMELAQLQSATDDGGAVQAQATQALEALRAKKTMVLAGFGLAGLAILGLTVVAATRSRADDYEYEEDYE